jgi:hypothetical protein
MKNNDNTTVIFRPWYFCKSKGRRIYAWEYGKRAFRFEIDAEKPWTGEA